jgi:uncharacterized protein
VKLYRRHLAAVTEQLVSEEPVILIGGPRASGKTTLVRELARKKGVEVLDLSDDRELELARQDVAGYLAERPAPIIIDEYQRLPELLGAVKRAVDRDRRPGAFVLTGSTTGELLPRGTETLTGRVHRMVLWGLSHGEVLGRRESFIELAFAQPERLRRHRDAVTTRADYGRLVARGGFPAAVQREREVARRRWHRGYAESVIERDLAELVSLRQPAIFSQTLKSCAARTAQVTNLSDVANDLGAGRDAVRNYLELLERIFLVRRLPPLSGNLNARLSHHPKLHLTDSGLAVSLSGVDPEKLARTAEFGAFLETFVATELLKQLGWTASEVSLSYYRDRDGHEVDLVLERLDGQVVAIEVKSANFIEGKDVKNLRYLADRLGADFRHGFVLYTGASGTRLEDDRFSAIPISALWAT